MSRDLRLYSLSLALLLMLWFAPARADYNDGTCPTLAVPVQLSGDDVWASYDDTNEDGYALYDYRDLYPVSGTSADAYSGDGDMYNCVVEAGAGTYYDGSNHMWVLDDDLSCNFVGSGEGGDFRAGGY